MRKQLSRDYTRLFLFVWWIVHFCHLFYLSPVGDSSVVSEGSAFNQVDSLALLAIGLYHFRVAWRRLKLVKGVWLAALVLYTAWAILTIAWSDDPTLTIRRLQVFIVELVAWIGIGAGYYGGEDGPARLCRDFRFGCITLIVLAAPIFGPELTPANLLNPSWESSLRDKGPETVEAFVFGLLACLAPAVMQDKGSPGRFRIFVVQGSAILLFLLVTKGRSAIALTLIVLGLSWTRTIRNKLARVSFQVFLALTMAFLITSLSTDMLQETVFGQFLSRGNDVRTLQKLNGRTPLWEYVIVDIQQHFLRGTGFGAYWTAERMSVVAARIGWGAPVAHNGYLDETVQTGLIGMGLILGFLVGVIARVRKLSKRYPVALVAISWICLFLLLNLTDSYFQNFRRMAVVATMTMSFSCLGVAQIKSRRVNSPPEHIRPVRRLLRPQPLPQRLA